MNLEDLRGLMFAETFKGGSILEQDLRTQQPRPFVVRDLIDGSNQKTQPSLCLRNAILSKSIESLELHIAQRVRTVP